MDAPGITIRRARELRRRMTFPEILLWQVLRRVPQGLRFRRQHPIGPFILDFYCDEVRLAVEIDGAHHGPETRQARDAMRDAWLEKNGVTVLRFAARAVLENRGAVLEVIVRWALERRMRREANP